MTTRRTCKAETSRKYTFATTLKNSVRVLGKNDTAVYLAVDTALPLKYRASELAT